MVWLVLTIVCAGFMVAVKVIDIRRLPGTSLTVIAYREWLQRKTASWNTRMARKLPDHELLAFVGVFTALKPDRRQALRDAWFPSSVDQLER